MQIFRLHCRIHEMNEICETRIFLLFRCLEAWLTVSSRVARWFIFEPKIPIWVNFVVPWIGNCLYILCPSVIDYGLLGYSMTILYILCSFGTFFLVLVSCAKKNLATLTKAATLLCRGQFFVRSIFAENHLPRNF
jgi:hypothetical protein